MDPQTLDPNRFAGVVTRTLIFDAMSGSHSSGSCCGRGSPRPESVVSEDAERVAGREMALDVECVMDGMNSGPEPREE